MYLFAQNIDVLLFNHNKIMNEHGQLHIFLAEDEGDRHYLDQFLAPSSGKSRLSSYAANQLVNGKTGSLEKIEENKMYVSFIIRGEKRTVGIERFNFTKYDPVSKTYLSKRRQFPLTLAYAFTIHKAFGMSIDNLVVDCKNATFPGQIEVAVGRAKSIEGLCITNFKCTLCLPHPAPSPPPGDAGISVENTSSVSPACRKRRLKGRRYIAIVADTA